MFGDAGFGEGDDGFARQLAAGPFERAAEANALFGEPVDFIVEAQPMRIAHLVGCAGEFDDADSVHVLFLVSSFKAIIAQSACQNSAGAF